MNFILALILQTNIARASFHDFPPLTENRTLDQIAQYRADEMCSGNISHDGFGPAVQKYKSEFVLFGENIAHNYRTPETITQAFLNSPTHRTNMLSILYDQIGIGKCGTVVVEEYGRKR